MAQYDTPKNGDFVKYMEQRSQSAFNHTTQTQKVSNKKPSLPPFIPTTVKHKPKAKTHNNGSTSPSNYSNKHASPIAQEPQRLTMAQRATQQRRLQLLGLFGLAITVISIISLFQTSQSYSSSRSSYSGGLLMLSIGYGALSLAWNRYKKLRAS